MIFDLDNTLWDGEGKNMGFVGEIKAVQFEESGRVREVQHEDKRLSVFKESYTALLRVHKVRLLASHNFVIVGHQCCGRLQGD